MTFGMFPALVMAIAILTVLLVVTLALPRKERRGSFSKRDVLSTYEQAMYNRLVECLSAPQYVVLAQVSLGALLKAKGSAGAHGFSDRTAHFVVLDPSFGVLAIVELDDRSHKGRRMSDATADAVLIEVGYRVIRYTTIPDRNKLLEDFGFEALGGADASAALQPGSGHVVLQQV